jgi:predicted transport protein
VKKALKRLWVQTPKTEISSAYEFGVQHIPTKKKSVREKEYSEEHHIEGKLKEVLELYRTIDRFCRELDPTAVQKKFLAKYVRYSHEKNIFCCIHLQKSGLRVWLKLSYLALESPPEYARDVSKIGHWGVGDVEIAIDSLDRLQNAKLLIQKSFEENK